MNQRGDAMRRPARASMPPRNRRRWQIAAGVVLLWIILWIATGSIAGAFIFLIALAALSIVNIPFLRRDVEITTQQNL